MLGEFTLPTFALGLIADHRLHRDATSGRREHASQRPKPKAKSVTHAPGLKCLPMCPLDRGQPSTRARGGGCHRANCGTRPEGGKAVTVVAV